MIANPWTTASITTAVILAAGVPAKAQFGIAAAQGSMQSLNGQSVSVTGIEGVPSFISATTQRPFVTSLVPVVGDYGGAYAPIYGPAPLLPQYRGGPSVIQRRFAQMRREGLPPPPSQRERREIAAAARGKTQLANDFSSRLAAARKSSAGRPMESIAAIRRRQAQEDALRD